MSHRSVAYISLSIVCASALGCQSITNSVGALTGGMKSKKASIASSEGGQISKPVMVGGYPADHFTNSPNYQPLVSEAPPANPLVRMWESTANALGKAVDFRPRIDVAQDEVSLATKPLPIKGGLLAISGQHAEDQGNLAGAESQYRKALEQDPHDIHALSGLARVLSHQQRLVEAEEAYRNARRIHPDNASLANDMGLFYARQNRFDDAFAALNEAIRLGPDNARYRNNIATVYVDAGRADEALKHLMVVHLPAGAHYNLGYMLQRRGDVNAACEQFQLALQSDPSLVHARTMLARLTAPAANLAQQRPMAGNLVGTQGAMIPVRPAVASSTTLQVPIPTNHPLAGGTSARVAERQGERQAVGNSVQTQATSAPQDPQPPVVRFR